MTTAAHTVIALALLLCAVVPVHGQTEPRDVILMLDNSGSMKKHDPEFLTPLAAATLLDDLYGDVQVGVIVFDENVHLSVPLTPLDEAGRERVRASLDGLDFSGRLTDSPAALERAIYELRSNGRTGAQRSVVFLTDGIVDTGDPERDLYKSRWMRDELAGEAAEAEIRVFGVAFTEDADFQLIQSLAQRTRGAYYRAFTAEEIAPVFARIVRALDAPVLRPIPVAPEPPAVAPAPAAPRPVQTTPPAPDPPSTLPPDPEPVAAEETVIEEPASPPAPPPAPEPETSWMPYWLAGAVLVLAAAGGAGYWYSRRRSETRRHPEESYITPAFLNDLNDITARKSYELTDRFTVVGRLTGEDTNDTNFIVIDEATVGRRHATVEYRNHAYWVTDHNSLNGTYVNGERVTGEMRLKHGDRLQFHKYEFEFVMPELFGTGMTLMSQTLFAATGDGGFRADDSPTNLQPDALSDPEHAGS